MNHPHGLSRYAFPPGRDRDGFVLARLARLHDFEQQLMQSMPNELCVALGPDLAGLLVDLAQLGSLGVLTPHAGARAVQSVRGLEFHTVPESTEVMDLHGAIHLDTREIASALAVEERHEEGSLVGLQFFDANHEGILKLFAIPGSCFMTLGRLISRYAAPLASLPEDAPQTALLNSALVDVPSLHFLARQLRGELALAWELGNPFDLDAPYQRRSLANLAPGEYFPVMDPMYAEPASERFVSAYLLNAHTTLTPLEVVSFSAGLRHAMRFTPRRLQECEHGIHLIDEDAQIMIPREGLGAWRTEYGSSPTTCLEFLDVHGERRFVIRQAE